LPSPLPSPLPTAAAAGDSGSFNLGADYNLGGPHTLGDMAAAIEWAPNFITASPEALAAAQTKRQHRAPPGRIGYRVGRAAAHSSSSAAAAAAVGPSGSVELGRAGSSSSSRWLPEVSRYVCNPSGMQLVLCVCQWQRLLDMSAKHHQSPAGWGGSRRRASITGPDSQAVVGGLMLVCACL
jgi:hypothetical protein